MHPSSCLRVCCHGGATEDVGESASFWVENALRVTSSTSGTDTGRARDEAVRLDAPYGPLRQTLAWELANGTEAKLEM